MGWDFLSGSYDAVASAYEHRFLEELDGKPRDRELLDEFRDEQVPFAATLFELEEVVDAVHAAGLFVTIAERRAPYPSESSTFRLHVEARRPLADG